MFTMLSILAPPPPPYHQLDMFLTIVIKQEYYNVSERQNGFQLSKVFYYVYKVNQISVDGF